MIKNILIIGSGGFLGSVARYLVSQLNLTVSFHSVPVGTLAGERDWLPCHRISYRDCREKYDTDFGVETLSHGGIVRRVYHILGIRQ